MTDTAFESRSESLPVRVLRRLAGAAVSTGRWVRRLVDAEVDRRRTAALLELDDVHLRDIGVSRGEVYGALLTAAGEKASDHLSKVRSDRRCAERSQIRELARGTIDRRSAA